MTPLTVTFDESRPQGVPHEHCGLESCEICTPVGVDYEALLGKYVACIADWMGAGNELREEYLTKQHGFVHFTPAEWAALRKIAEEE